MKYYDFFDQDLRVIMSVESETDTEVTGKIVMTDSAYGDAVVHDRLETGRDITYEKAKMEELHVITEQGLIDQYDAFIRDGLALRARYARLFIPSDTIRVQVIEIVEDDGRYVFNFIQTDPDRNPVKDGVAPTQIWRIWINKKEFSATIQDIVTFFDGREDRVSTSGHFFDDTKVFFEDKFIGLLEDPAYGTIGEEDHIKLKAVLDSIKVIEKMRGAYNV